MKPPTFEYHRPETIAEVVALLSELGDEAKVLAGGQSLIPMLNMRLAAPQHLVDINRVRDFPGLAVDTDTIDIGALVRQHDVEASDEVYAAAPLLRQTLREVAHRAVRSRGTVVGSIVHADPAAELPAVLALLGDSVAATGPRGARTIPAADFYTDYFETALSHDELVTQIRLRRTQPGEGTEFVEVARRHGDFAICAAAATVHDGTARVALAGVDHVPRVFDASGLLDGDSGSVLDAIADAIEPEADIHGSSDYRRHLARALAARAVAGAAARSGINLDTPGGSG